MKKRIKFVAFPLITLALLGVGGHYLTVSLLKTKLADIVQEATGTPVTVRSLHLNAFLGHLQIRDIRIGNPPGYNADTALEIETLTVRVRPGSLLSDTILVKTVEIVRPFVRYEMKGPRANNIQEIQENIKRYTAAQKSDDPKEGKTVKIDSLHLRQGKVRVGATLLAGQGVTIPIPEKTINDIDTAKTEDDDPDDALPVILTRILRTVIGVSGKIVSEGVKGAGSAGSAAADSAKGLLEGLKDLAP